MTEVWFARRFPLRSMRSGLAPVHWKGWLVVLAFVLAMGLAGAVLWWFVSTGQMMKGALSFAGLSGVAMLGFIRVAHKRGDHINCVADYSKGKLRA